LLKIVSFPDDEVAQLKTMRQEIEVSALTFFLKSFYDSLSKSRNEGVVLDTLTDRWRRLLKEDDRFWGICLEVAKSKPYLCAEAVESEATLIFFGLKPKPKRE